MFIVHVYVHVKANCVDAFKTATIENATKSLEEPGVARFDVIQQKDDPNRFVLVEVYYDDQAPLLHKETAHYATWRETVADMMASPRTHSTFLNITPNREGWEV